MCVSTVKLEIKLVLFVLMNENPSTFFIYYGHGGMPGNSGNQSDRIGRKLHIGDDEMIWLS